MTLFRDLLASAGLSALLLAAAPPTLAQSATQGAPATASTLPQVEAEIRKIDAEAGKVTLKHGDIPNLDMPGMTMVFHVRDRSQLEGLKVGDKVLFRTDKVNGAYSAVDIVLQH